PAGPGRPAHDAGLMRPTDAAYEAVLAGARPLARVAAAVAGGDVRKGVQGRVETLRRFEEWGAARRREDRPLVWFHAPSVGEGLMAQAVIAALRERDPGVQVAFTHFSTSGERVAARVGADVAGYMPWDTRGPVRRALRSLRPTSLAFVRTEIWPVAVREARAMGARVTLVNAVLGEGSGRLRWPARPFLSRWYARLDAVGAVSGDHAARFRSLGVPEARLHVTGDARFDQVLARIEARRLSAYRAALAGGRDGAGDGARDGARDGAGGGGGGGSADPALAREAAAQLPEALGALFARLWTDRPFTLVAGSTWPADEAVLVPAIASLLRSAPGSLRVIIAPHQPDEAHLSGLEARLSEHRITSARLGTLLEGGSLDAVVVDRVGVLADLYALADAAYVGGGFGSAGLHSVVEPAGLGVPVLYGPAHGNALEAAELAEAGGGFVVADGDAVREMLRRLIRSPDARTRAGAAAGSFVRAGRGAAARNAALVLES
ncbi:MAG TPA: glycosyltransferase N-terminal domain-containing protein, partial [Longimicrobiales bacterium]|nr:glycosyltransferase N-terminal domain-containing protein [Longimicrobiales bacterium]